MKAPAGGKLNLYVKKYGEQDSIVAFDVDQNSPFEKKTISREVLRKGLRFGRDR